MKRERVPRRRWGAAASSRSSGHFRRRRERERERERDSPPAERTGRGALQPADLLCRAPSLVFVSISGNNLHGGIPRRSPLPPPPSTLDNDHHRETAEHYGCMVDLLGRAGHLQEALDMILGMKMEPSSVIWGALLGGCKIHGNTDIGEAARRQLMVFEPDSSGYFALSVNMYAQASEWNQVASIRGVMRDKGVQKRNPGCSWTEIDGEVYDFAASDKSHPKWGVVSALLDQLDGHLRRTYYLPHTDLHFL